MTLEISGDIFDGESRPATVDIINTVELCRVRTIVADVFFPGYTFQVEPINPEQMAIRVIYDEPDVMSGVVEEQHGRWWPIERKWHNGQIVQTCLKALLTSLEHRAREHFTWRGRNVFQPHFSMMTLWDIAKPVVGKPLFGSSPYLEELADN